MGFCQIFKLTYAYQDAPKGSIIKAMKKFLSDEEVMDILEADSIKKAQYSTQAGWIDLYGFNFNSTPLEERSDKLWHEYYRRFGNTSANK